MNETRIIILSIINVLLTGLSIFRLFKDHAECIFDWFLALYCVAALAVGTFALAFVSVALIWG